MQEIERLLGATFDHSITAVTDMNPFSNVTQGLIWLNVPAAHLIPYLNEYNALKQRLGRAVTVCTLIPGFMLDSVKPLITGMKLLKRYRKGSQLIEPVNPLKGEGPHRTRWHTYIFF